MTAQATLILTNDDTRNRACSWVRRAPAGSVVSFRRPKRSIGQNAHIHALCTDVAMQVEWSGARRDVEAWKDIFTAALRSANHSLDVVPGINGGFVLLGMHTSSMNKEEASELIDLILAFGAEHRVTFSDVTPAQLRE